MLEIELMPDVPAHRALWSGLPWLALVALWMRTCVWIDGDARAEFNSAMPWSLLLALWGPCLLAVPLLVGWDVSAAFLLMPCLVTAAYVWRRDTRTTEARRLVISPHMERVLRAAGRFGPLREAVAALRNARKSDAIRVTCGNEEGQPTAARRSRRRRRDIASAVEITQPIFAKAFACRAHAVHLEPRAGGKVDLLYQVDGVFNRLKSVPRAHGAMLASALKNLAGMKPYDNLRPQTGTFCVELAAEQRRVVARTCHSLHGQKLELRLQGEPLAGGQYGQGLAAIGLPWRDCEAMQKIITQPRGMVLISGPAQSGRTTTAYAALSQISPLFRSIVTIEDPIEERLPFAIQSPVVPEADRTFPNVLRAVLLQDSDVVFVGEMRDRETAEIAMQAADDRLVIATIEAADSASSLVRLLEFGVDPAFLRDAVSGVLAQQLARKLCTFCRRPSPPPTDFRNKLGPLASTDILIYRRGRCDACHCLGYSGLVPVTELLLMNDGIRGLLDTRPKSRNIRRQARQAGMRTLRESAIELIRNGDTSIREVLRVIH